MREISLDRLRTLVAIADHGSFAEAARVLNLAPPTVSLHIADLEARVGGLLLSRTRGRVQPSAIGETLIERARRLLTDAEQALEDVERQVQGLAGRVGLGASTGVIAQLIPQALETLSQEHAGIDVQVAVLTSQQTLQKLADGSLDIGVIALPQSTVKGLQIKPWRRDPIMAFLPARWACPDVISPDWLAAQPLILNDNSTRLSRQVGSGSRRKGRNRRRGFSSTTTTRSRAWWRPGMARPCCPMKPQRRCQRAASSCVRCNRRCGESWASPTAPERSNARPGMCWRCCGGWKRCNEGRRTCGRERAREWPFQRASHR